MELRQLNYLLVIAEEGNYTRAAERLFVSQPAITQQIQKLENELGVQLFDRSRRKIQLTEAGEVVYRTAQTLFREIDETRLALDDLSQLNRGTLRVGVVQTVNAYLIPSVVAQYREQYPNIQLYVEELSMDEIENRVDMGTLHLGIGFTPTTSDTIEPVPLFTERLLLIMAKAHQFAHTTQINMNAVNGEMVMLPRTFCTRRLWDDYAAEAAIMPTISIEMNTINGILQTVQRNSRLITVLPELALSNRSDYDDLIGIPIVDPTPQRTVSVLWRQNGYRSAAASAFYNIVQEISNTQLHLRQ